MIVEIIFNHASKWDYCESVHCLFYSQKLITQVLDVFLMGCGCDIRGNYL